MNIILLGPPGAGKGTQAERLADTLTIPHVASGDIFRDIRQQDTPLARQVRAFMDRGEYVPDQLTIELVLARLQRPDARPGFILDGFPRTCDQAESLDRALAVDARKVDLVLNITASTETLMQRLAGRLVCLHCHAVYNAVTKPPGHDMICDVCGHPVERRTDETPEVIQRRLDTYAQQTCPVLDYYAEQGKLLEVRGEGTLQQVNAAVDAAIDLSARPTA